MLVSVSGEAATIIPCRLVTTSTPVPLKATFVLKDVDVSIFVREGWTPLSAKGGLRNPDANYSFHTKDGSKRSAKLEVFEPKRFKLTVFAGEGDEYEVPLLSRCGSGAYVAHTSATTDQSPLPTFAIEGSRNELIISNRQMNTSYLSVKWANLAGDLERGHFARSEYWQWSRPVRRNPRVGPSPPQGELVYIEFFQQNVDGSTLDWKGWAATNAKNVLTVGKGNPPKEVSKIYSASSRCPSPIIHRVPPIPNFAGSAPEVVEDESGTPLRTASSKLGFVVEAKAGKPFRMERAPRSVCPILYQVEEESKHAFSLPKQIPLSRYGDDNTYSLEFWFGSMERRWPPLKLRWSASRKGLSKATASIPDRPGFSNYWPSYFVVPNSLDEFYVEIEPQWADPKMRVGVTARVRLNRNSDTWVAYFDPLTPRP